MRGVKAGNKSLINELWLNKTTVRAVLNHGWREGGGRWAEDGEGDGRRVVCGEGGVR